MSDQPAITLLTGDNSRLTITQGIYDESQRDQDDRQSHLDGWMYFSGQLLALALMR